MKSLAVEDDFTSRLVLQKLLTPLGECHLAVNGEEALAAFSQSLDGYEPYDLILMDIHMPGISGIEAVAKIREMEESRGTLSTHGVKILMATSEESPKQVVQSFNALCDGYIVKPVHAGNLLKQLHNLKLIPALPIIDLCHYCQDLGHLLSEEALAIQK